MSICTIKTLSKKSNGILKDFGIPYFVAEVNSSHNGNIDTAKNMIDAAAVAGCDCVKFQSWSVSSLYSKTYYKENPIAKRFVKKFSLTPSELKMMCDYAHSKEIDFSSTPYSEEEVDFLVEDCQAPFVKISSMELNNLNFLKYIVAKKVPVVLSTGMGEIEEIRRAVKTLEKGGAEQITLLHCVSIYPAKLETLNLNNILGLREEFPYPIGFSDHTLGNDAAIAAVALGAALIEKHLTLDRNKVGMDNFMATEPAELKIFVKKCREIQVAMGIKEKILQPEEYEQRKKMRRSIIAAKDLKAGDILTQDNISCKRPGTGISPDKIDEILNKKVIRYIEADTLINLDDIEDGAL